jgi:hypothetical protein
MASTTFSRREFNEHAGEATKAASKGPVFITDHGRAAYVLLSIDAYRALTDSGKNIATLLAMPDTDDFELSTPERSDPARAAELD